MVDTISIDAISGQYNNQIASYHGKTLTKSLEVVTEIFTGGYTTVKFLVKSNKLGARTERYFDNISRAIQSYNDII